jgi:sporadic carbohydrate cluster 2OG-Fe(II) oxygenase
MLKKSQLEKLHTQGFVVIKAKDTTALKKLKKEIINSLKKDFKERDIINNYHKKYNDKKNYILQSKTQKFIKKNNLHFEIIQKNKSIFASILGNDICATKHVNFRVVRPSIAYDNINFHRDTDLGHTPYELNVWTPLFNTNKNNTLCILPKSHLKKLTYFKSKKINTKFRKGSLHNRLGFLYKSFKHKNFEDRLMKQIKCKFGHLLIFYSSCMHGTKSNISNETRFSLDFNISNSFYPIKWKHHGAEEKYNKIISSKIVTIAQQK